MSFSSQPLELDYIYVKSPSAPQPACSSGLWNQLVFRFKALLASFTEDYATLSGDTGEDNATEQLRVWVALGRDQGQLIKDLTESRYTPDTGVKVQISLMQTGLNEAIAAGRGPDIAMFTGDVVNLASREAIQDLSDCEGFEEAVSYWRSHREEFSVVLITEAGLFASEGLTITAEKPITTLEGTE